MNQDELTKRAEVLLTRAGLDEPCGAVSAPEAARMCEAFGGGASVEAIAEGLQRPVATVRDVLERFKPTIEASRARLAAGALPAADHWVQVAQTSKNHFAAKDLLLHMGAIAPIDVRGDRGSRVTLTVRQPGDSPLEVQVVAVHTEK